MTQLTQRGAADSYAKVLHAHKLLNRDIQVGCTRHARRRILQHTFRMFSRPSSATVTIFASWTSRRSDKGAMQPSVTRYLICSGLPPLVAFEIAHAASCTQVCRGGNDIKLLEFGAWNDPMTRKRTSHFVLVLLRRQEDFVRRGCHLQTVEREYGTHGEVGMRKLLGFMLISTYRTYNIKRLIHRDINAKN